MPCKKSSSRLPTWPAPTFLDPKHEERTTDEVVRARVAPSLLLGVRPAPPNALRSLQVSSILHLAHPCYRPRPCRISQMAKGDAGRWRFPSRLSSSFEPSPARETTSPLALHRYMRCARARGDTEFRFRPSCNSCSDENGDERRGTCLYRPTLSFPPQLLSHLYLARKKSVDSLIVY